MKKVVLFVFNGDPMCFIHVLLNAIDMKEKAFDVKIVIEGAAVKLIPELAKKENPQNKLWEKVKAAELVAGVCKACSHKLGTLKDAESQKLELLNDMSGHPSIAKYMDDGYEVMTF
jgi:hypothetical protein